MDVGNQTKPELHAANWNGAGLGFNCSPIASRLGSFVGRKSFEARLTRVGSHPGVKYWEIVDDKLSAHLTARLAIRKAKSRS